VENKNRKIKMYRNIDPARGIIVGNI